jgi:general secretion pathway protein B
VSLILDALRKADSQRGRGSVPDLHAQPAPAPGIEASWWSRPRPWLWALAGTTLVLAVALSAYLAGRQLPFQPVASGSRGATASPQVAPPASMPVEPAAPPAVPAPAVTATRTTPQASAAPAATVPSPAPVAPASPDASPAAPAPEPQPRPVAAPAPWPQQDSATQSAKQAAATPSQGQPQAAATPPADKPASDPPIYAREQLPPNIRAELPALSIGGAIYSPRAPDRSLIVNGRLFRENDTLAQDLLLEQIRQRSAVFRFKGYRFEVPL